MTPYQCLAVIGQTDSINELNNAYNEIILLAGQLDFGTTSRDEVEATINHITNYNIVRIAGKAAEDFDASMKTDISRLVEIELCRSSLKRHEDMDTEQGLLDSLCEQFGIS